MHILKFKQILISCSIHTFIFTKVCMAVSSKQKYSIVDSKLYQGDENLGFDPDLLTSYVTFG